MTCLCGVLYSTFRAVLPFLFALTLLPPYASISLSRALSLSRCISRSISVSIQCSSFSSFTISHFFSIFSQHKCASENISGRLQQAFALISLPGPGGIANEISSLLCVYMSLKYHPINIHTAVWQTA